MPESLHQQLTQAAAKAKRKKAAVGRMALEQAFKDLEEDTVVG
ncbi:MAG: hypothetical protein ACHWZW_02995 [Spirulina sp.]